MTTNVVECKDCAYGREANVPNAVFCMLNHQTFSIPVYGCANGRPGRIVPQTNADRIRGMTDEELAEWVKLMVCKYRSCGNCPMSDWCEPDKGIAEWLKTPVEVQDG